MTEPRTPNVIDQALAEHPSVAVYGLFSGGHVGCQCACHRGEHILDEDCWCDPYRDSVEPSVIIHRKQGVA